MQLSISKTAASKHKQAYQEIVEHLGTDITWSYDWGVLIQSTPFTDIVSGKAHKAAQKERERTLDERLEDIKLNIRCGLQGKVGRKSHYVCLSDVPRKVLDYYRTQFAKCMAEEQRIDGLTEEQRLAEAQTLLKELRKVSGFMEFRVRGLEPDSGVE
jgi:hypothetical protein